MKKEDFEAIAILIGTIVGAGVLGIPYIVSKAGLLTGLIDIIIIGILLLITNYIFGESIINIKKHHQMTGYTKIILGKKWGYLMMFLVFASIYGALIAYIMGEGSVLATLFGSQKTLLFSILFFIIAFSIVKSKIKTIGVLEIFLDSAFIFIIFLIALFSTGSINTTNITGFDVTNIFLPYGVILFAFLGISAIPQMKEVLNNDKKRLRRAILIGSSIPIILYLIFTFAVVSVTGLNTTEVATIGLGQALGYKMLIFCNLFAFFIMSTAFLSLAHAVKETYIYDCKLNKTLSWMLACLVPFAIFLAIRSIAGFKDILNITGGIAGGAMGILLATMFLKTRKKKELKDYLLCLTLIAVFLAGIVYTIV